ncbi:MAG: YdcF family protein [Bacteroidia bacterium]|nr:YdcF family protein [Bacteroidia bacterium]
MKFVRYTLVLILLTVLLVFGINYRVNSLSKNYIFKTTKDVPESYTALVLGAFVYKSGHLSGILQDRVEKAVELYKNKKVKRFLLSGDHGRKKYDEVNSMKKYLLEKGIDTADIFLDHAGFDTYNSMVRAKEVFEVNDVIIVSQEFHLPRAVYIARSKGLNAYGVMAEDTYYPSINSLKTREIFANLKAFYEVLINKKPKFLGKKIPITGNSHLSYD